MKVLLVNLTLLAFLLSCDSSQNVDVKGELKMWHKVTLTFDGPETNENATPNPFTDYRLNVTFSHSSGVTYTVPGYYAADGNASQSSADSGNKWRVHFSPDNTGEWTWTVLFRKGENIAMSSDAGESAGYMDEQTGVIEITETDKLAPDFRAKGRLDYVGKHYLQFAGTKDYFLKCGPDSPETFLACVDFDGTVQGIKKKPMKTWEDHVQDWKAEDPTWKDGKGKGMIGAINYLSEMGANSFSFLTYNAGGDGDNVWPFNKRESKLRYDCSKLDQWQIVFEHAQKKGVYLHFKTQEKENDDNIQKEKVLDFVPEALDQGDLGPERKLYYRELIARFGSNLALNWNLGEENTQSYEQRVAMASYIHETDPYNHHIVIHNVPKDWVATFFPLFENKTAVTGSSIQCGLRQIHQRTLALVKGSTNAEYPWVVANDEQGTAMLGAVPDTDYKGYNPEEYGVSMHDTRKYALWANLMAGGAGVEYYFGYKLIDNDIVGESYRSREKSWKYGRRAINFFHQQNIPFWEMIANDSLTADEKDYVFMKEGEIYLIYQLEGKPLNLEFGDDNFECGYFNPRAIDEDITVMDKMEIQGPKKEMLTPPDNKDWLIMIKAKNGGTVKQ